jgi:hypothetical protein
MSLSTSDVISRFDSLEEALKSVFPKVDPRSVVGLILNEKRERNPLYTLETVIKPGQNTDDVLYMDVMYSINFILVNIPARFYIV